MKDFPIDIFSVTDIEKWSESFYWPVSQEFVEKMGENLFFEIRAFIHGINNDILNAILRTQVKHFFNYFFNILHTVKVIEELKRNDFKIVSNLQTPYLGASFTLKSSLYKEIIEHGAPVSYVACKWDLKLGNIRDLLKSGYRFVRNESNWRWNKLRGDNELLIVVFNPNPALLSHLNNTREKVIITSSEQWLFGYKEIPLSKESRGLIKDASVALRKVVNDIARKSDIFFTNKLSSYIENFSYVNLKYTFKLFNHLVNQKKLSKPIHLWAGGNGIFSTRLLSEAVRHRGGVVSHFPHSGGVSRYKKIDYILTLLTTGDRFGVYNQNEIPLFDRLVERFPLIQKKKIGFFYVYSDEYKRLWELNKKKPLPGRVKEIMFVPTSYQGDSRSIYHLSDLVHLDWEFRLIKILIFAGYNIIYKKHPKGRLRNLPFDVFGNNIKYVYEPFQEIMDMGDAFLFDTAPSTAMYEAMCTRKPVIFINYDVPKSYPEPRALLAKRCRIVSAKLDERNRIIVNENDLLEALNQTPTEPNYEYLKKYLFSGKAR